MCWWVWAFFSRIAHTHKYYVCGLYVGYPDPLGLGQGSWNKIGRESATAVVLIALKIVVLECRPGAKSKITRWIWTRASEWGSRISLMYVWVSIFVTFFTRTRARQPVVVTPGQRMTDAAWEFRKNVQLAAAASSDFGASTREFSVLWQHQLRTFSHRWRQFPSVSHSWPMPTAAGIFSYLPFLCISVSPCLLWFL